ncbi:hypothetical protein BDB01DRAFT_881412 [Pilobolus umbonatus]|nr:hypothetical protein BDB01DRAFT_881412 [Pilobolus umbonatus]
MGMISKHGFICIPLVGLFPHISLNTIKNTLMMYSYGNRNYMQLVVTLMVTRYVMNKGTPITPLHCGNNDDIIACYTGVSDHMLISITLIYIYILHGGQINRDQTNYTFLVIKSTKGHVIPFYGSLESALVHMNINSLSSLLFLCGVMINQHGFRPIYVEVTYST